MTPDLDFETYSEAGYVLNAGKWVGPPGAPKGQKGLPVVGAYNSIRHPSFRLVWLAYDLKQGGGPERWRPGLPPPRDLFAYLATGGPVEAWNVSYERWVWELYCVPSLGWPAVLPGQWRCAMAKARAYALPGKLEKAAEAMASPVRKDPRGGALMKRLSMPVNPTASDPRRVILPVYDGISQAATAAVLLEHARSRELGATDRKVDGMIARALAVAQQDAEDTEAYGQYNVTDIQAEACVSDLTPDLSADELAWWQCHETINRRGVHIDRKAMDDCIVVLEQALLEYNGELHETTGVDSASKVAQLQSWLRERNVHLSSLDEETVAEELKKPGLPPDARRVLEIRAAVGSASVKKLYSIRNRLSEDGRLRDLYVYHGARTGRSTGEGPQPTNLPKAGPNLIQCVCGQFYGVGRITCHACDALRHAGQASIEWSPKIVDQALSHVAARSLQWVEHVYGKGQALAVLAGCLRGLFDAAPGMDLISTDYASVEAVGLAMISGEAWRIHVFNTHGKIYEASAATAFRVPLEDIVAHKALTGQHHPLRQLGKGLELACGYQGWVGAALAFGVPGTEDEIKDGILKWRQASPAVVWLWGGQQKRNAASVVRNALLPEYDGSVAEWAKPLAETAWSEGTETYYFGVEGMAVLAMLEQREWHGVTRLDGTASGWAFFGEGKTLFFRLPSGRLLTYHNVLLVAGERAGLALSYEGWNTNPKNGPMGWVRMDTWGGRLVENGNQATCRDILAPACVALEARGYPVVLHVYDEIVAEVSEGWGSVEEFEEIVTVPPAWAAGWPIQAPGGYRSKRYRKG